MKITLTICPNCGDGIFSRAHHDYHSCSCKAVSIDGGFDYVRGGWNDKLVKFEDIKSIKIELDVTKKQLYDDWNLSQDKFGRFSKEEMVKYEDKKLS